MFIKEVQLFSSTALWTCAEYGKCKKTSKNNIHVKHQNIRLKV